MENSIPIEELLYEEEGTTLDFKRKQYPLNDENDFVKGEILKDILAFANAWRRTDAYILLGVEEVKGGRSKPIGIDFELDDAQLQQFVNTKTQKPITFDYKTVISDGLKIGVIRIPQQSRPFYVTKDFGRVKRHVVYVRRGSSTAEAEPDEVHNMGKAEVSESTETPNLSFEFADLDTRTRLGNTLSYEISLLDIPKSVPDYSDPRRFDPLHYLQGTANSDFYRKLVLYYYALSKFMPLAFCITNNSKITASDVKVEIVIDSNYDEIALITQKQLPDRPKTHYHIHDHIVPFADQMAAQKITPDINIQDLGRSFRIEVVFGKVQPMQSVFTRDLIYIGSNESCNLKVTAKIFADNIPFPISSDHELTLNVQNVSKTLDEIVEMNNQCIYLEYKQNEQLN